MRDKPIRFRDLLEKDLRPPRKDRKHARINYDTLEICIGPMSNDPSSTDLGYPVDLERCSTPAQLLDYILQVAKKPWVERNPQVLYDFIDALQEASREILGSGLQRHICPSGQGKRVDWTQEPKPHRG